MIPTSRDTTSIHFARHANADKTSRGAEVRGEDRLPDGTVRAALKGASYKTLFQKGERTSVRKTAISTRAPLTEDYLIETFCGRVDYMREVRIESLEGLEITDGEIRLPAHSDNLRIVFPANIWPSLLASIPTHDEPNPEEFAELEDLKRHLMQHAEALSFTTILEGVQCGGERSNLEYDLVLRPASLYAVTTGYFFAPVVEPEIMARIGVSLEEDSFVEQAYVIGAVATEQALAAGDDNVKALSVRGRRCTSSRFEMAPELWQVLSERMGWKNVDTAVTEKR